MKVDITKLNYKELIELEKEVKKLIEAKREEEKNIFINTIKELSLDAGFDLEEIFHSVSKAKMKIKKVKKEVVAVVKYKKSDNETWSGRGRKPLWVQEFINNGGNLEEFLILK